jgi:hypothetical protein
MAPRNPLRRSVVRVGLTLQVQLKLEHSTKLGQPRHVRDLRTSKSGGTDTKPRRPKNVRPATLDRHSQLDSVIRRVNQILFSAEVTLCGLD